MRKQIQGANKSHAVWIAAAGALLIVYGLVLAVTK